MTQLLRIEQFEYDVEQIIPNNHGLARKLCEVIEKFNILLNQIEPNVIIFQKIAEAQAIAASNIIEAEIIDENNIMENI